MSEKFIHPLFVSITANNQELFEKTLPDTYVNSIKSELGQTPMDAVIESERWHMAQPLIARGSEVTTEQARVLKDAQKKGKIRVDSELPWLR